MTEEKQIYFRMRYGEPTEIGNCICDVDVEPPERGLFFEMEEGVRNGKSIRSFACAKCGAYWASLWKGRPFNSGEYFVTGTFVVCENTLNSTELAEIILGPWARTLLPSAAAEVIKI